VHLGSWRQEVLQSERMPDRHILAITSMLTAALAVLPDARGKGKTYVIKGMGTHYTRKGRQIRRARPHRRLPLVRLRNGPGFVVGKPDRAWGTRLLVYQINRIMALYRARFPKAPPVIIHDLSRRGGGVLDNHNSHVDGRDVDIPLILNPARDVADTTPRSVNLERMWFVIKALADTCDVEYMFLDRKIQEQLHRHAREQGASSKELSLILQYPAKITTSVGLVRHWQNHQDHVHVRFRHERSPVMPAAKEYCDWKARQGAARATPTMSRPRR